MFTCLILVAVLPSVLSAAVAIAAVVATVNAPSYPVGPDTFEAADTVLTAPYVIRDGAVYSPAPVKAIEYDRNGRRLPAWDSRGRFTRSNDVVLY